MFQDTGMPSEPQRQKFCYMIHRAFLEIRILGWAGKSEQAADLADAFHNLPTYLWSTDFSLQFFRHFLESYQEKYSEGWGLSYLKLLDEIESEGDNQKTGDQCQRES